MTKKKLVFLGSKPIGYECLSYLIAQKDAVGVEITGLLTRSRKEFGDAHDLTELAGKHGIPLIGSLDEIPECEILYSVQYHELLKPHHIAKASEIAVNLHMAPLPEYRGANQFSFAILENAHEFGTSIHKIDPLIDHGDILFQKRFPIPEKCWVGELYELTFKASVKLFQQSLQHLVKSNYYSVPQEALIARFGTSLHFRKEMEELKKIDLNWEKEKIELHIRATSMPGFEPPYCIINGEKVYFTKK